MIHKQCTIGFLNDPETVYNGIPQWSTNGQWDYPMIYKWTMGLLNDPKTFLNESRTFLIDLQTVYSEFSKWSTNFNTPGFLNDSQLVYSGVSNNPQTVYNMVSKCTLWYTGHRTYCISLQTQLKSVSLTCNHY